MVKKSHPDKKKIRVIIKIDIFGLFFSFSSPETHNLSLTYLFGIEEVCHDAAVILESATLGKAAYGLDVLLQRSAIEELHLVEQFCFTRENVFLSQVLGTFVVGTCIWATVINAFALCRRFKEGALPRCLVCAPGQQLVDLVVVVVVVTYAQEALHVVLHGAAKGGRVYRLELADTLVRQRLDDMELVVQELADFLVVQLAKGRVHVIVPVEILSRRDARIKAIQAGWGKYQVLPCIYGWESRWGRPCGQSPRT